MGGGGVTSKRDTPHRGLAAATGRPERFLKRVPRNRHPSRSQRTQEPHEPSAEPATLPKRPYDTSHLDLEEQAAKGSGLEWAATLASTHANFVKETTEVVLGAWREQLKR